MNYTPDGTFPNGVPNPLLPENRADTSMQVVQTGADPGVAFDGDFDLCFFFDEERNFIEGYYLVGILAASLLKDRPGEKIIHDPRLYWNTREMTEAAGGIPVIGRSGHALMKEQMRAVNALYGGEMSAHHYFRDFAFCDSGMLAMLLVLRHVQNARKTLGEIVSSCVGAYPCSGERNFHCADAGGAIERIWEKYAPSSLVQHRLDGINLEYADWRFNLRRSNTEPLLRLNVETRANRNLLEDKLGELIELIESNN